MMSDTQNRRSALKKIVASIFAASLLPGCDNKDRVRQDVVENLSGLLRHPRVAAHLGRLETEANPKLKSVTIEDLVADILSSINLDIDNLSGQEIRTIAEKLTARIRQDFADESVTRVDGWLLSQTEAKVCALVFLDLTQAANN